MPDISVLLNKTKTTFQNEGVKAVFIKGSGKIKKKLNGQVSIPSCIATDVLFISGCGASVPHPHRYRVTHQRHQLYMANINSDEVYVTDLTMEHLRRFRMFIFFRCPCTPTVEKFIIKAKALNKIVIFDIDDLVFDTKYTDTIKYVSNMSTEEKRSYDEGVNGYRKTLSLCEAAVTTTEALANELRKYCSEVFINRNVASEDMVRLSQRALEMRDVIPNWRDNMLFDRRARKLYSESLALHKAKQKHGFVIGYFSGSITHGEDFEQALPAIIRILKENSKVTLLIMGELIIPAELATFGERIIVLPFGSWTDLPLQIAMVDINIAPLKTSVFNEAKSENKWVEAALVKVPTVASNLGAFHQMITNNVNGLLCSNDEEWYQALNGLITNDERRHKIGEKAYQYCMENCIVAKTGDAYSEYIKSKMRTNVLFILPTLDVSGGVLVALKHAEILQSHGYDVSIRADTQQQWYIYKNRCIPVLSQNTTYFKMIIDKAVETVWFTQRWAEEYAAIRQRYYLVQNYEPGFYQHGNQNVINANQTYYPLCDTIFITISCWCQQWLKNRYHKEARYAPNGLDSSLFEAKKRDFSFDRIRILVEGDCSSFYKNVDESFRIIEKLDTDCFEVWYLSAHGKKKDFYRVDKEFYAIPNQEVAAIYQQCDILLKSSQLESFSYPPLEMMATGGMVVVAKNDGNVEYVRDGINCLTYTLGDVDEAVRAIKRISSDAELRDRLYQGGQQTARSRTWSGIQDQIIALYL